MSATIEWHRDPAGATARVAWRAPDDAEGTYRMCYLDVAAVTPTVEFSVTGLSR